jgi:predicted RNA-binding protein YlqC (UPF0109 family)
VTDEASDSIEAIAEAGDEVLDDELLDDEYEPDDEGPAATASAVLTHIVRSIVDDGDAVRVQAAEGRHRIQLQVRVGEGDLGRVIGRRGRTAQSIRTVVRAAAVRDGVEVDVDFVD